VAFISETIIAFASKCKLFVSFDVHLIVINDMFIFVSFNVSVTVGSAPLQNYSLVMRIIASI